jgi:hypothetical protein
VGVIEEVVIEMQVQTANQKQEESSRVQATSAREPCDDGLQLDGRTPVSSSRGQQGRVKRLRSANSSTPYSQNQEANPLTGVDRPDETEAHTPPVVLSSARLSKYHLPDEPQSQSPAILKQLETSAQPGLKAFSVGSPSLASELASVPVEAQPSGLLATSPPSPPMTRSKFSAMKPSSRCFQVLGSEGDVPNNGEAPSLVSLTPASSWVSVPVEREPRALLSTPPASQPTKRSKTSSWKRRRLQQRDSADAPTEDPELRVPGIQWPASPTKKGLVGSQLRTDEGQEGKGSGDV